jgi:hypothetical protein
MASVIVVPPSGSSFATQTYPKITVTNSAPTYTTPWDTTHFMRPARGIALLELVKTADVLPARSRSTNIASSVELALQHQDLSVI